LHSFPIPDDIDDDIAAAVLNPGLSAWGALAWRAKLAVGETVLILGASGVIGKLTAQTAKLLGSGRVVAAGRNEQVLSTLHELGADSTIRLDRSGPELTEAFAREAGKAGFDVIIEGRLAKRAKRSQNGHYSVARFMCGAVGFHESIHLPYPVGGYQRGGLTTGFRPMAR
jgi:NADPH:quinone reductase-like Zn-dependent oxidoreductase